MQEQITELQTPIINSAENEIMNVIKNQAEDAPVGTRTLDVLKKVRNGAFRNLCRTKGIRKGDANLLRVLFEDKLMQSDPRSVDTTGQTTFMSCENIETPLKVLDFSQSPKVTPRRRTRSMGKVEDIPRVQPRTLEYKQRNNN